PCLHADRLRHPARHRRADRTRRRQPRCRMSAPLLDVTGLSRRFGGLKAVDDIAITIQPGEIMGLLGPHGSGKTTVLNLISGALTADAGSIRLDGGEISGLAPHRIARLGVARTFQLVRMLPSMNCPGNVLAGLA